MALYHNGRRMSRKIFHAAERRDSGEAMQKGLQRRYFDVIIQIEDYDDSRRRCVRSPGNNS
jgi:hypothetical protein